MLVHASIVTAAKNRGIRHLASSAKPGEQFSQVDAVVDLLAHSTSPAAQPGARRLLQEMSAVTWTIIRGAHTSADDNTLHVTIEVGRYRYHLRLDRQSCIFDITHVEAKETQRLSGHLPWVSPGA